MRCFPFIFILLIAFGCCPCKVESVAQYPDIFPDYIGVTVPEIMTDIPFVMNDGSRFKTDIRKDADTLWIEVTAWKKGSRSACRYKPFPIFVSSSQIDPYIAYRLIEPGYEGWHDMAICQRDLSSFKEKTIVHNTSYDRGCINCHTFKNGSPDEYLFHVRGKNGGTMFVGPCGTNILNLATVGPKKQGTYPAWHPDGRYVAFSSNSTHQNFTVADTQPLEVYDTASDIILMDMQDMSVQCPDILADNSKLETFPAWSSDGDKLFYCCADTVRDPVEDRARVHYSIMYSNFDGGSFTGVPETVWQCDTASASFPRVFDKWMLFTVSSYGTFPIWHREADLCILDLETGEMRVVDELNSPDTESFHSWSSNGEWLVFSSRRLDGRYTRLFISHFDGKGHFTKPFLLPQRHPESNTLRLKSYNVPVFIKGEVARL